MRERLKGHFGDRASFTLTRDETAGVTVARIAMPQRQGRGMIRAVLVDDEPPARVRMRQLLDAAGDVDGRRRSRQRRRSARGDSRHAARPAVPRRRDAGSARHRAGGVAAGAAALHRLCHRVRQLRARSHRRRRHRLPVEAGVARQARGHARSRARAARRSRPSNATWRPRPRCRRTCGRARCR